MRERELGEGLGALKAAGVAEGDRQVAVGLAEQVVVAGLQRDVQGLAGRLHAAAQLAALGQCNRLAAVLVAVELDLVVLVKQRALAGQRQQRVDIVQALQRAAGRSEEHTSELQSLMRISYAVFCLKKK